MHFTATVTHIKDRPIVVLPPEISQQFPSRGMAMARGLVDGQAFSTVLEPDGRGSHWFTPPPASENTIDIELSPESKWVEATVPEDLESALASDPVAQGVWQAITPSARWDWIRWIRATSNVKTRQKRITVAFDKMHKGSRRPCCFNRSMCTVPEVSKNGVLLV